MCVSDDLQSVCGEVPAGEIPPGVPGAQREVSETERRGQPESCRHVCVAEFIFFRRKYGKYDEQPLTGWSTGCR